MVPDISTHWPFIFGAGFSKEFQIRPARFSDFSLEQLYIERVTATELGISYKILGRAFVSILVSPNAHKAQ